MPRRFPRPCNRAGCKGLVQDNVCSACGPRPKHGTDNRQGAAARGYDANWQALRQAYITDHPLCERCMSQGRARVAAMVHHKHAIRKGGDALPDNDGLMSVCVECHAREHSKIGKIVKWDTPPVVPPTRGGYPSLGG